jgi:hypothetical protein
LSSIFTTFQNSYENQKGTLIDVNHSRSGKWRSIATKDFDTEKDAWYPIALAQEETVYGVVNSREHGADMPARKGLGSIRLVA